MKARAIMALGCAAIPFLSLAQVVNGDFSAGNTVFSSSYTYVGTQGPGAMYGETTYTVTNLAPQAFHNLWTGTNLSPLPGKEEYMLVNGATSNNVTLWSETMTLAPGAYYFNYDATSVYAGENASSAADLALNVTGQAIDSVDSQNILFNSGTFQAHQIDFTTTGGAVTLKLYDTNTAPGGNDFAITRLNVQAVPEPSTGMAFLACGAVVPAILRNRKKRQS